MSQAQPVVLHDVRFSLDVPLGPDAAWHALTAGINDWWPADYRATHAGSVMTLETRLGGRLIEGAGHGNGVVWYQVIALDAPRSLTLSGFVAPPFGGPATSLLHLALHAQDGGGCALQLHDSLLGRADAREVESGWRAIFGAFEVHAASLR